MGLKLIVLLYFILGSTQSLELKNGAYEDLVIKIAETVPDNDCTVVLENLEATLTSASQYLFSALDSRALFIRSATVLLPPSWSDSCSPSAVLGASGETSDITVLPSNPVRGNVYTQQSLGCGQPGDQIFFGYESFLQKDNTLGRSLIKEFAKYRYGVFEEQGYYNDPVHPLCYYDDQNKKGKLTGCSDLPINDNGICTDSSIPYNVTQMVDSNARSSIMFAAEAPSVSMFCDHGTHDRFAPTKHNLMCQGRSVLSVITEHPDLKGNVHNNLDSSQIIDTTPRIVYKKQSLTRYVFVIENTKDMMRRESWSYLRLALRQWALYGLPENTEIGLVLTNISAPIKALNLVSIKDSLRDKFSGSNNRDKFYSSIPYTPGEFMQPGCMHCSIKTAMEMLTDRTKSTGPANNVIVVIAPGLTVIDEHLKSVVTDLKKNKIRVATINYPDVIRPNTLRYLADETNGVDYAVFEQIANVATTSLTTYFELHNVFKDIVRRFYSGSEADFMIEIHRRKIVEDGSQTVAGRFMLEPNLGEPAQFTVYTHNSITPRINQLKLTSPNNHVFTTSNQKFIDFKMITLDANISETGTWTYNIKHEIENRQPHFLQVMATPRSAKVPVVRVSFRTHRNKIGDPLILLANVMFGDKPVMGAKVEVTVTKAETNGSTKFDLLDTGSGDPDVTKGDGVYTRYFSADEWGPGLFTFEVTVTNDIGSAKTWSGSESNEGKPCCGSTISSRGEQPISPFQRVLPKVTLRITPEEIASARETTVGRIGDLRVEVIPKDMKARLSWTSPDMGGLQVTKYELRYTTTVSDIVDNYETIAKLWDDREPFPLEAGSETTFSLDFSQNKELLDKPLYFAVKSYAKVTPDFSGPVSNWVRVLVPSPPPPPTIAPTYSSNEQSFWPNNYNSVGIDPVGPSISKSISLGLELILPIIIGIILLVVLLIVYCYFCVLRKRTRNDQKSAKTNAIKKDNMSANITIVPSSPQNLPHSVSQNYSIGDIPDPHQVGVPVSNYGYEEETKKRYSLVNQQEQQLIEELKQQQQMHQHPPSYAGVSVISNTITRNGHTLSPFNSWSASQLLHEHERRHSPMENMMTDDQIMSHQDVLMNGSQIDHMSINGQNIDHMSVNGHQVPEHYPQGHLPPPVPPLPAFSNGYSVNYSIYGVHQAPPAQQQNQHQIYQSMTRTEPLVPYNGSLQGSMSSVNSGDKKRRNVTMV